MTATPPPEAIAAEILKQTSALGPGGSVSPEDIAKALSPDWRPLLGPVRRAAIDLSGAGRIDILRKGKPVPPADVRGVVRLRASVPTNSGSHPGPLPEGEGAGKSLSSPSPSGRGPLSSPSPSGRGPG